MEARNIFIILLHNRWKHFWNECFKDKIWKWEFWYSCLHLSLKMPVNCPATVLRLLDEVKKNDVLPFQSHGACKLCVYVILKSTVAYSILPWYSPTFIQSHFILSPNYFQVSSKFLLSDWILFLKYFLYLLWILYLLGESGVPNVYLALKIRHCKLISQLCIITLWLRHFCVPVIFWCCCI